MSDSNTVLLDTVAHGELPRRGFLTGASALALTTGLQSLGFTAAFAQQVTPAHRIDIHHHILPPAYLKVMEGRRSAPFSPDWSPSRSLEELDQNGIATAMLSIVQPGVWHGNDAEGRTLARLCNDYGAQMVRDQPRRFGLFACLPLADVPGSLKEMEYALDVLKADGIALMTSFGNRWLGDVSFWPVLEELNRRKAVVYTHPTQPDCCRGLVAGVLPSTIEWITDTSRTIASLLFSGTAARFPDIRWIFSHGGGTMPFLVGRLRTQEKLMQDRATKLPRGLDFELRKFYYETAQANHPGALAALTRIVPSSQVLLGTDYPYRRAREEIAPLEAYGFSSEELRAIERDNALQLLPRVAAVQSAQAGV